MGVQEQGLHWMLCFWEFSGPAGSFRWPSHARATVLPSTVECHPCGSVNITKAHFSANVMVRLFLTPMCGVQDERKSLKKLLRCSLNPPHGMLLKDRSQENFCFMASFGPLMDSCFPYHFCPRRTHHMAWPPQSFEGNQPRPGGKLWRGFRLAFLPRSG